MNNHRLQVPRAYAERAKVLWLNMESDGVMIPGVKEITLPVVERMAYLEGLQVLEARYLKQSPEPDRLK